MKTILITILTLIMVSCNGGTKSSTTINPTSVVKSEKIMDEVGIGLYKVELDSNTTILIYRADPASDGTESISMIQLK